MHKFHNASGAYVDIPWIDARSLRGHIMVESNCKDGGVWSQMHRTNNMGIQTTIYFSYILFMN